MRVVFLGTTEFAKTILEYLYDQKVEIKAVVTRPDKPKGRSNKPSPSAVKVFAEAKGLPLYQPVKASEISFCEFLKTLQADFFIVAAFGEILKEHFLQIPKYASLNVHGSVLPKYRGAAPVARAIMEGEKETGVTIVKMNVQLDAGEILAIRKTPIPLEMTAGELMGVLADLGKTALLKVMQQFEKNALTMIAQNPQEVSYAKKLTLEDAKVDWSRSSLAVHNQIRGVTPHPGAWCWIEIKGEKKRLLIKKTLPHSERGLAGEILSKKPLELIVGCGQDSLSILEVQLEGKKSMPIDLFLRGTPLSALKFVS